MVDSKHIFWLQCYPCLDILSDVPLGQDISGLSWYSDGSCVLMVKRTFEKLHAQICFVLWKFLQICSLPSLPCMEFGSCYISQLVFVIGRATAAPYSCWLLWNGIDLKLTLLYKDEINSVCGSLSWNRFIWEYVPIASTSKAAYEK